MCFFRVPCNTVFDNQALVGFHFIKFLNIFYSVWKPLSLLYMLVCSEKLKKRLVYWRKAINLFSVWEIAEKTFAVLSFSN